MSSLTKEAQRGTEGLTPQIRGSGRNGRIKVAGDDLPEAPAGGDVLYPVDHLAWILHMRQQYLC